MTIKEMMLRKRELGYTNEMISEKAGVPLGTVQKIFSGFTKSPRQKTIRALEQVLQDPFEKPEEQWDWSRPHMLRDSAVRAGNQGDLLNEFPNQGNYTVQDYYALPDERRVELIDGYFYDMAAPSDVHQLILGQLHLQIAPCVDKHPDHMTFMSPSDVRPKRRKKTVVQPDLYVLCNFKEIDPNTYARTPDFVIEILSPSNRSHDLFRKLYLYKEIGVREYWIVDPENEEVTVYDFEHERLPVSYTFDDTVPIHISEGQCSVDFAPIRDRVRLYHSSFPDKPKNRRKRKSSEKKTNA